MCDIHIIKSRSVLTGSRTRPRFLGYLAQAGPTRPVWPWSRTDIDRLLFGTDRCGNRGIDRISPNPDRPDRGIDKCRSVPGRIPVLTRPEAITGSSCKSFINDSKRWSGRDLTSVMSSAPSSLNDLSVKYLVKKWSGKQVDVIGHFEIGIAKSSINEYFTLKCLYCISHGRAWWICCGEYQSFWVF